MPKVGKKKYPYTPAGMRQAKADASKMGKTMKTGNSKKKKRSY